MTNYGVAALYNRNLPSVTSLPVCPQSAEFVWFGWPLFSVLPCFFRVVLSNCRSFFSSSRSSYYICWRKHGPPRPPRRLTLPRWCCWHLLQCVVNCPGTRTCFTPLPTIISSSISCSSSTFNVSGSPQKSYHPFSVFTSILSFQSFYHIADWGLLIIYLWVGRLVHSSAE